MKTQDNKAKTAATLIAVLVIGMVLSTPMSMLPKAIAEQQPNGVTYNISSLKPGEVMTPFGPMNATNVHHWNGTVLDVDRVLAKEAQDIASGKIKKLPGTTNWNEYASYVAPSAVTTASGYWTVPSTPTSTYSNGQVLFLFNDLMDSGHTVIIQPVLQWGSSAAYTGNNWELVSWLVTSGGQAWYSTPISVNVGDQIYGSMVKISSTWTITGKDTTQNTQTALAISSSASYVEADETLETSTNLTQQCSYLSGNTAFTSLSVGSYTPSWTANTPGPTWCHMSVQVISSTAVTLHTQS